MPTPDPRDVSSVLAWICILSAFALVALLSGVHP